MLFNVLQVIPMCSAIKTHHLVLNQRLSTGCGPLLHFNNTIPLVGELDAARLQEGGKRVLMQAWFYHQKAAILTTIRKCNSIPAMSTPKGSFLANFLRFCDQRTLGNVPTAALAWYSRMGNAMANSS